MVGSGVSSKEGHDSQRLTGAGFYGILCNRLAMDMIRRKPFQLMGFRQILGTFVAAIFLLTILSTPSYSRVIDGVAIIVNKDAILVSEVNEAMMPLLQEYRARYAGAELKQKMDELREAIINQAIESKLILQVAKQNGITASEKNVDARIEAVKKRFGSEDEFLQALAGRGVTYKEYRDQVSEQVLTQDTIKIVLGAGITVSENEIEEYYKEKPDEFVTDPQVKLAQIFIQIPEGSSPEEIEQLRQKTEQLQILLEDGVDFLELAAQYSEGPYREKGGVIGVVGPNEILPDLESTAFSLEAGEVSATLQTAYGFHILKALEASPARKVELEEAKEYIEERINEKKRTEKYGDWIEKLKENAYIEIKI